MAQGAHFVLEHKRLDELSVEEASWLAGYEVVIKKAQAGDEHTDTILKVRLVDPTKYVELAGKLGRFGLFEERVHVSSDDIIIAKLAVDGVHPRNSLKCVLG